MKNRILYILLCCIGLLFTPRVSKACASAVNSKSCTTQKLQHHKSSVEKHSCCHKDRKVKHADCKHCSGHSCTCSGSVRSSFDTSLTEAYDLSFVTQYWQDLAAIAVADQSYLSAGFYSCWLPPKI
ncbi:hypothetical protein [Edaphocola flava]|jgi:hypothetical protein|uniref:hypothetical protein n=1 Tax=Edaphocola flava TaxID=2499629 RepID=UPI00100ADB11|nr:hypothetical protein [Edaphocola flava]